MSIYYGYVQQALTPQQLEAERKAQLRRIGELRGSSVLTYAARMSWMPVQVPTMVLPEDVLPFSDMLDTLSGPRVSVIIETPGGVGETGRQMVELLHERFDHVEFIVPGMAMSTGTIMALGGNEILMGPTSALGPIDAQLLQDGKQFSADALLEGFRSIKAEVDEKGALNPAYIPILQRISPGELQHAQHALEFARETVTEWLCRYKFANWSERETSKQPVTEECRRGRARDLAEQLSSQARWRTHGRFIRIPDLVPLGLKIKDYTQEDGLGEAVQRYYALLRLTIDSETIFKLFETPDALFVRRFSVVPPALPAAPAPPPPVAPPKDIRSVLLQAVCANCQHQTAVQLDFAPDVPLRADAVAYPGDGNLSCPSCAQLLNLAPARADIERQLGRPALVRPPSPPV